MKQDVVRYGTACMECPSDRGSEVDIDNPQLLIWVMVAGPSSAQTVGIDAYFIGLGDTVSPTTGTEHGTSTTVTMRTECFRTANFDCFFSIVIVSCLSRLHFKALLELDNWSSGRNRGYNKRVIVAVVV